jgi:hypothetical protein
MIQQQKIIAVLVGVLFPCAAVQADLVPLSPVDAGYRPSPQVRIPADSASTSSLSALVDLPRAADRGLLSAGLLPEPRAQTRQTSEVKPAQILRDGQSSLSLCLYALFGLGLCESASSVKKVRFGCIADRCCRGPFQIGRSSAISLDCLCSASVACFVQPDFTTEDCLPQCYRGAIAPLLQKSRFKPITLASRGPPCMSRLKIASRRTCDMGAITPLIVLLNRTD